MRRQLSATQVRAMAKKAMDVSQSTMSKFISSTSPELKVNLRAVALMIAVSNLKLVAANDDTFNPQTHTAVPNNVLRAGRVLSSIGHSVVVFIEKNGADEIPAEIKKTFNSQ